MDPEIQRALSEGVPPDMIIAELGKRGIPVPPELQAMTQQTQTQEPSPVEQYGPAAGLAAGAAGTVGGVGYGLNQAFNPKERARRFLEQAVKESGGAPSLRMTLDAYQAAGRGDMVTLGDLSKRMGASADFVATNNPAARTKLSDIHEARQKGVPGRVAADVEGAVGYQAPEYMKRLVGQSQADFAASDAGFQGLRDKNPVIAPQAVSGLQAFIDSPKLKDVWDQAAEVGSIGPMPKAEALSFETLQGMKQRMDDAVGHAFASGRGPLGARLAAARDQLVATMAEAIPEYRPVAAQYHTFSKQKEMLQAGQDAWNARMQLGDLEQTWHALSPEDQKAFREGMGGELFKRVENSHTNTNIARQLLTDGPMIEKKMELVFGGAPAAQAFIEKLKLEKQMASMGEIVGGSQTARRLGQQADIADQVIGGAEAMTHPVSSAAQAVRKAPEYFAGPVARKLEPLYTEQGYGAISRILRSLR